MITDRVTEADRATFWRDGVVCLRGMFSADWVDLMRDATRQIQEKGPGPTAVQHEEGFFSSIFTYRDNELTRRFAMESPAAQLCADLFDSTSARLYMDQLLVKEPGTAAGTPWHQDQPYLRVNGRQLATLWLALDPVTVDNGAVHFIAGSHEWGYFAPEVFAPGHERGGEFPPQPDIVGRLDEFDVLHFDLEPGDCTVHHGLVFHGGYALEGATQRRRGYAIRYVGDDIRYAVRQKSHPFPQEPRLHDGDPLTDEDVFPLVLPRA